MLKERILLNIEHVEVMVKKAAKEERPQEQKNTTCTQLRGFAKEKKPKNPRLLWKWVGGSRSHSEFFLGEILPK